MPDRPRWATSSDRCIAALSALDRRLPAVPCTTETLWFDDGTAVLRVTGEVDQRTLPGVRAALVRSLAVLPHRLIVDLAAVELCSGAGLGLLVEDGPTTASEFGVEYELRGLSAPLRLFASLLFSSYRRAQGERRAPS